MIFCGIRLTIFFILTSSTSTSLADSSEDSILDIVNTKEVERIIAENQRNADNEKRYLLENDFNENYLPANEEIEIKKLKPFDGTDFTRRTDNPRVDIDSYVRKNNGTDPYKNIQLLSDLRGFNGRHLLKSSRKALYVTRKEYLKKDWCKTEPLIQKVKEPGCITGTLINRFCYGQCNSFYIPKNPKRRYRQPKPSEEREDEDQFGPSFKSCGFCKPSKFTWVTITLKCPSKVPKFRKKRIQRIKQCKCMPANV